MYFSSRHCRCQLPQHCRFVNHKALCSSRPLRFTACAETSVFSRNENIVCMPRMSLTEVTLKIDVQQMSRNLADDPRISSYKLARAFKRLDDELQAIKGRHGAIPMEIIFARAILRRARELRYEAERQQK